MKFELISPEEFETYMLTHPLRDFSMSSAMDPVQAQSGWNSEYAAMKEDGKILCATKLLYRQARLGKTAWRAPRGFLIDYHDRKLLKTFTDELSKYIKSKKGYVLTIDPKVIHIQRDIDGKPVEGGINNEAVTEYLKSIGYDHLGYFTGYDVSRQPQWVFVKDVKGMSEKDLKKSLSSTTKRWINRAAKFCTVRELDYSELYKLDDVIQNTGQRRGFECRDLAYYEQMYQQFHDKGQVKFLVAEMNVPQKLAELENELRKEEKKLEKLTPETTKYTAQQQLIESSRKNLELLQEVEKNHPGRETIVLSASMFMTFGPDVEYYFSGSYQEFMHFNAQYLIQWEMMKYAAANGFDRHNFQGISGIFDESDPEYGVYKFKRGFGGYVEEYLSEFELPLSPLYHVEKLVQKIRK